MLAIIQVGGKQYIVEPGSRIRVDKFDIKEDKQVVFDSVLLYDSDKEVKIGNPYVQDVQVSGKVISEGKAQKLIVYKYRRRKRTHVKKGHRQSYVQVEITSIGAKKDAPKAAAKAKATGESTTKGRKLTAKPRVAVRKVAKTESLPKRK